jgi:hypothetical protein
MVLNKKGGNKSKNLARKHTIVRDRNLVVKTCELEHYGCVEKVYGGRLCSVTNVKGEHYKLHVRGKFKCNVVGVGSIVLFGERDFASSKEDCDLLYVYEERDFGSLIGIEKLLEMRNSGSGGKLGTGKSAGEDGEICFSMDAPDVMVGGGGFVGGGGGGGGGVIEYVHGGGFTSEELADI